MPLANLPGRLDASNRLVVSVEGAGSGGTSKVDNSSFAAGADGFTPAGGFVDDSAPSVIGEGDAGAVRITPNRAFHVNLRAEDGSELSPGGGTEYQQADAAPTNPTGKSAVLVRDDARAAASTSDGDFVAQKGTSKGEAYVKDGDLLAALGPSTDAAVSGDNDGSVNAHTRGLTTILADVWDAASHFLKVSIQNSTLAVTQSGSWVLAAGSALIGKVGIDQTTPGTTNKVSIGTDGTVAVNTALPAGNNNIGDVDLASAVPAGTNVIGKVGIDQTTPGTTNKVNIGTDGSVAAAGPGAHGASISGNPIRTAARALSTAYAAVTAGQTADLVASLLGKLLILPYALPADTWSYASVSGGITDTADDAAKAAGGSGIRHYVTHVDVVNAHATVGTEVVIKDGSTVIWRSYAAPVGGGASATFDPPLRGTANTAINVTNITTGAQTYFNLTGYSAQE